MVPRHVRTYTHLDDPDSDFPTRHLCVVTELIVNLSYLTPLLAKTVKVVAQFHVELVSHTNKHLCVCVCACVCMTTPPYDTCLLIFPVRQSVDRPPYTHVLLMTHLTLASQDILQSNLPMGQPRVGEPARLTQEVIHICTQQTDCDGVDSVSLRL